MPSPLPPGLRLFRLLGLTSAATLFGATYPLTIHLLPSLLSSLSPSPTTGSATTNTNTKALIPAFLTSANRLRRFTTTLACVSAGSFALVAHAVRTADGVRTSWDDWGYYALAAGLVAGMVPFDGLCLVRTERKLSTGEGEVKVGGGADGGTYVGEVRCALEKWGRKNMWRAMMAFASAVVGGYACSGEGIGY